MTEMRVVEVVGVRQHLSDEGIVVLLLEPVERVVVPIVVGPFEASAIAAALGGITPPRPMTHDLLAAVLAATESGPEQVEITELADGVFHAALVLADGTRVDSRASDAIAVAVRADCPVLCSAEVVQEAGVATDGSYEQEVERFREFLDHVTPEDFDGPAPEGSETE